MRLRFALAYPHTYHVGMSNLGLQTIYRLVNQRQDALCERVFLPDPADVSHYGYGNAPLLSVETQRPAGDFHLVGFSVSYENDYLHLLHMLAMLRIPLLAAERDERHPLIVVGGAVTYINPEPLADFVDLMIIGDGEEALNEYLDLAHDTLGQPRRDHLRQAADIPGVYVPALHDRSADTTPMPPRKITDLSGWPAYSTVLTDDTEFSGSLLIEVTRGCPVQVPVLHRRLRVSEISPVAGGNVLDIVAAQQRRDRESGLPPVGKVGLISSATGDYRALPTVAQGLVDLGVAIGISSLRMDRMPDVLIDCMVRSGVRSCTVAPEAGSERLRQLVRKEMSEAVILEGVERLLAYGMRDLKLYSMIGLPTETDDGRAGTTIPGIQDLGAHEALRSGPRRPGHPDPERQSVHPQAATPLQWCAMAPQRTVKAKLNTLRQALRRESSIRLQHGSLKDDYLEAILARGDRRLGAFLLETHRQQGNWSRAAKALGFDAMGPRLPAALS